MKSRVGVYGITICFIVAVILTLAACRAPEIRYVTQEVIVRETVVVRETPIVAIGVTPVPATNTPEPVNNPPAPSIPDLAILLYNYQVEDTGDGWKVGTVDLAFANTSDQPIPPQVIGFYLLDIRVETLEGKTYPAGLFITWDPPGGYTSAEGVNPIVVGRSQKSLGGFSYEVNPNGLPLPPHLPFSMILAKYADTISDNPTIYYSLSGDQRRYFVQFRFAGAANPTRLIMPSENFEYRIDLLAPGTNSTELTPITFTPRSLQDLSNDISQNNNNVQVSFGQCYQDDDNYPHDYYLPFTISNKNQLDETRLDYNHAIWYSNGVYLTSNVQEGGSFLRAGPGQTVEGKIKILNWGIPQLLVIYNGDDANIYSLNCGSPQTGSLTREQTQIITPSASSPMLVQGVEPDRSTEAYRLAIASGWQAAAENLLAQMTTQVTFNTYSGEADTVTLDDDQMTRRIVGEKERIEVKPNHCAIWWGWGGENTGARFSAQQDWQLIQGPGNAQEGYGMMIRADGNSHYQFGIRDKEQQFDIEYWLQGNAEIIQDWKFTDAIRPGQVNRIGVVADDEHFYFLINGIVVAELNDDRTKDGVMGSFFNTCDINNLTIFETDNFELRKP